MSVSVNESIAGGASSGGGSMVYPGAGVALSTGTAWDTSLNPNSLGSLVEGRTITGTDSLVLADASTRLNSTSASNYNITVPANATVDWDTLAISKVPDIEVFVSGAGLPTFVGAGGVSISGEAGVTALAQGTFMRITWVSSNTWKVLVSGSASMAPSAFTARTLTDADNGKVFTVATAQAATVNTGLIAGFGCTFVGAGALTTAGTATVTDYRTSGATNPACSILQIGTDTYGVYGSKA